MFYSEAFELYADEKAGTMDDEYETYLESCLCKCEECVCKEEEWHKEYHEWLHSLWEKETDYFDETYGECI